MCVLVRACVCMKTELRLSYCDGIGFTKAHVSHIAREIGGRGADNANEVCFTHLESLYPNSVAQPGHYASASLPFQMGNI